jgi:hypothetical protein
LDWLKEAEGSSQTPVGRGRVAGSREAAVVEDAGYSPQQI